MQPLRTSLQRLLCTLLFAAGLARPALADGQADLIINEIQVANLDMFIDLSYNYGGWIELYNPTESSVTLYGLTITDDPAEPAKYKFPAGLGYVQAGSYKTVWFDHNTPSTDNRYSSNAYKQVNFKLAYEGGTIYIFDSSGQLLLSQEYPPAVARCSWARTTDGDSEWSFCSTPTPGATNVGSTFASEQLAAPVVDRDGGLFSEAFYVHVQIPDDAQLRYTTDGSVPTLTNGERSYTGSIRVADATTVLRLRLFRDGYLPSDVVTRTFVYRDRDYYLPIVSVATAPDNLYDNRIGVYVDGTNGISGNNKNSSNKNRAWERPVNFEYLVPADGQATAYQSALNQETDFEVCGGWSRHFAPSSFRLKAAKQYGGKNFLPYDFFPSQKTAIKHKAVQVRNGGNDYHCRIIDAAVHQCLLRSGFYIDCQSLQPVHVFFNGQFQYTYNLREPSNKNLSYSNYGIDKDEVDEFEINGSQGYVQKSGDDTAFRQWMALSKLFAGNASDDAVYQQICDLVDIDEYCNYMAAECYIGSSDWLTNCNNVKGFRSRADGGRFHLVMLDVDAAFAWTDMISRLPNSLYDGRYSTGRSFLIDIFLNMLKYEPFKRKFIDAFCIVAGSVFEPQRCEAIIRELATRTETALGWEGQSPWSSANSLISKISSNSRRTERINNLANYFRLTEGYTVSLSTDLPGATLRLNQQEVPTGRFSGTLFGAVSAEVAAPAGYRFRGWLSDGLAGNQETILPLDAEWKYYDKGSLDGKNWNARYYSTTTWKTGKGPLGYGTVGIEAGKGDYATTLDYGSSNNKRPTYYFRNSFNLSSLPTSDDVFQLTYYVDDGCVIYLNGTEIARYHMPEGTPTYDQYSTTYEGNQAYAATIVLDNSLLRTGVNVIAAEVHNTSAISSDIFWGASLSKGSFAVLSTEPAIDLDHYASGSQPCTLIAKFEAIPDVELADVVATPIRVNEVSAGNSVYINDWFKKNDWFELYNATDTDLDAAGLYLSDDLANPTKYQVPTSSPLNTIVPAHGHLVLWADKLENLSQLHTGFKLGNNDDELVLLTASDDFRQRNEAFCNLHPEWADFADALVYAAHDGDQTVGRYPDGGNTFYLMHRPTFGRANSLHTFDTVVGIDTGVPEAPDGIDDLAASAPSSDSSTGPSSDTSTAAVSATGYYDLGGRYLGHDRAALRPGIYVLRHSDGSSRKVFIPSRGA